MKKIKDVGITGKLRPINTENDSTTGFENFFAAVCMEMCFQLTCKINHDNFNMYDREAYMMDCPITHQIAYKYSLKDKSSKHHNPKTSYPYNLPKGEIVYAVYPSLYLENKKRASYYDLIRGGKLECEDARRQVKEADDEINGKTKKTFSISFAVYKFIDGNKIKCDLGKIKSDTPITNNILSRMSWKI